MREREREREGERERERDREKIFRKITKFETFKIVWFDQFAGNM